MRADEVAGLWAFMTPEERQEIMGLLNADGAIWRPLPGPQSDAYHSPADVVGFGGSAGGGKTDLMCGTLLTQHRRGMILRSAGTELTAVEDRVEELLGSREGFNSQKGIWKTARRDGVRVQLEFGSLPNPGDHAKYQGRPHDFIGFDEAANLREAQVRFLLGWLRTTTKGQRCRALMTFNPPTDAEGRWIIGFFGPWLDDKHPNPAKPGELRWFATVAGKDMEVADGRRFVIVDGSPVYDFRPRDFTPDQIVQPMSRTFIPSRLTDNPYLMGTGYMATLQALPEPLRSQMLNGDFMAGAEDDAMQVIPTEWVDAAMARWKPKDVKGTMDSLGVDVARGGRDKTIIARRYGTWFDVLLEMPGTMSPDGPTTGSYVIAARRDKAPIHIDMIGWGSSPFDFLVDNKMQTVGINNAEGTEETTNDQAALPFCNVRAETWWRMREELDPENKNPIALPPDPGLRADLCAPRWRLRAGGILIEAKEDVAKRIGRSPDRGDAAVLALISTKKTEATRKPLVMPQYGAV